MTMPHIARADDPDAWTTVPAMRGGAGQVAIRRCDFGGAARPARFVLYALAPGAAEGVHTHYADDRNGIGAYDEFYFIIAGRGVMTLGEDRIAVGPGDYIHAPLDMPRGLANPDDHATLHVHLCFIERTPVARG